MAKNIKAPDEPDDASADRAFSKNEPGMPEQLGSGIVVDGKPYKLPFKPGSTKDIKPETLPYKPGSAKDAKMQQMAKGGMTASERADGIASRGKTKGKIY